MNDMIRRAGWFAMASALALVTGFGPASAQSPATHQDRLDALIAEQRKVTNEFFEENWTEDLTEDERKELYAQRPGLEFAPKFEALALDAKGTDVAVSATMESFGIYCDFQKKKEAEGNLARLLDECIASKVLVRLPSALAYSFAELAAPGQVKLALEKLLEKSPHKEVKASALYSLAQSSCGSTSSDAEKAEGRKQFARLIAEFGDLKSYNKTYRDSAEGFLFELDNLQIGMVAPDFESIDENGTKFKLSDYRGKVTVIDFWGNW